MGDPVQYKTKTIFINGFFFSVVGLDACSENIEAAREHLSLDPDLQERLSYQCCTVEEVRLDAKLSIVMIYL